MLRRFISLIAVGAVLTGTIQARQPQILDTWRPRIALAADGSYAIAWEALVDDITRAWKIAVQRYDPAGAAVGPLHFFDGESCSGIDIWTSDFMEHAELAFQSNGTLLVLMTHTGDFSIQVDHIFTSEATLGAIDANGQLVDLSDSGNCVQHKLIFPGGGRQTVPRLAVGPDDRVYITQQGGFDVGETENWFTNVAIRVLDGAGNELVEQLIPHADPLSQTSFHAYPDIAVSASLIAAVWHECVMIDQQGNTNDCDIGVQFFNTQGQPVGGNRKVNDAGVGQAGTYSIWPSIAMNASGQSVVVWGDTRTGVQGDVFGQRFDASGQPVGGNVQVSMGEGQVMRRPEVALLNSGRFFVTWDDSSAAGYRARGRVFAADGTPEGPPFLLSDDPAQATGLPATASNGEAFIYAWAGAAPEGQVPEVFTSDVVSEVANEEAPVPEASTLQVTGYPNPFGTAATIRYELPEAGPVRVAVYDILGREVARLVDHTEVAGRHEITLDAAAWPSGLYLVRVQQGNRIQTRLLMHQPAP